MPRRNKQIKHTPVQFNNNCDSKRQFLNKREAEEATEYQMLINPDLQLSVYQCGQALFLVFRNFCLHP